MGRTLRKPPYGLAEPFPIRVPAGSKHQKALERSGLITRGRTAQLRDSPLKETATPATEGGGSAFAFTFTPLKSDPLLRLLICDLVGEEVTRESLTTLRDDIADIEERLDDAELRAKQLPHRERYLLIVTGFLRRLLELHLELVDEVEQKLAGDAVTASTPPRSADARG